MSGPEQKEVSPSALPVPEIPKCLQIRSVTKGLISYAESLEMKQCRRAAHACIWAPHPGFTNFGECRAAIMMHLRFDGTFGFPGGLIEDGEDVIDGLNREMAEEIGWNPALETRKNMVLHFFIVQITLEQFTELEKNCVLAPEYGNEVFGTIRVPLYTMANEYSGLPAFLNNKFIGIAKQQLLLALYQQKIMPESEITEVLYKSQNYKLAPSRV
ncbi:U8 snoRNA-decapping enzyme [Penaeus vannamei]|uniref:U8 snoRNA-decapping enzyme n=1 Tax=Penaeus vannamei TaxID=6689 RepID=A0A3R7Q6I8_PENVA|nr:U8 snoRNA-decapping enzyme [Penaeus vannamei]